MVRARRANSVNSVNSVNAAKPGAKKQRRISLAAGIQSSDGCFVRSLALSEREHGGDGAVVGGVLLIGQAVSLAREHRSHLRLGQRRLHPHLIGGSGPGSELGVETS